MGRRGKGGLAVLAIFAVWLLVSKVFAPSVGDSVESASNSATQGLTKAQNATQRVTDSASRMIDNSAPQH